MSDISNTLRQRLLVAAVAVVATFTLAACNTMKGAGKDVEAAGEKVQDVAESAKP